MDGIINLLKPPGMTSHDAVNIVRRLTGVRRTGHTGTLDPGAAGVLPVCVGKATRVSEYVLEMDKSYRAELTLGRATDTEDAAGETLLQMPYTVPDPDTARAVLRGFLGDSEQIPPMYSAVRVDGKKLYELARRGEVIRRQPRPITIYDIRLLRIQGPVLLFDVSCSRGTYVRTLCREIAEGLGTTGHMSFLVRTKVGPFTLENSKTFEELFMSKENDSLTDCLLPLDSALSKLTKVTVDNRDAEKINNGLPIRVNQEIPEHAHLRVYGNNNDLLAIAVMEAGWAKPHKVFKL
jgi:tRNA pseudouridine55 synthase